MIRARLILPGIAFASWLGVGVTVAGGLVEFPNVSERAPRLLGYLARPDAGLSALAGRQFDRVGPYPAIIVLHGCSRRPRTRKRRPAHSLTFISPRHLAVSRRQSDPRWAARLLIAHLAWSRESRSTRY